MKISLALLILLLAAACTDIKAASFRSPGATSRTKCCTKQMLVHRNIPSSIIQDFHYTASSCTIRAVLVEVKKGTLCVSPEEKWFQAYLKKQKKPNTIST